MQTIEQAFGPTRRSIEDEIERLITMLDMTDPDPDLELDDDEPSLGWPDRGPAQLDLHAHHDDREQDDCDLEDGRDAEPSYGWQNQGNQWSLHSDSGHVLEREEENEHAGDLLDEPHDAADQGDDEPNFGWSECCGQAIDGTVQSYDRAFGTDYDGEEYDGNSYDTPLAFTGEGYDIGRDLLRRTWGKTQPTSNVVLLKPGSFQLTQ